MKTLPLTFAETCRIIRLARRFEDLFPDPTALHATFLQMAKLVHPDAQSPANATRAEAAFKQLNHFYHLPLTAQSGGGSAGIQENGVLADPVILTTKRYIHTIARRVKAGGTSTLFAGTAADKTTIHPAYFKVPNQAIDNDLIEREAKALRNINRVAKGNMLANRVPRLIETVKLSKPGQQCVNVLEDQEGTWHTLEEIRHAYPEGVEPRVGAFIFNRLLESISVAHRAGFLHGVVTPNHVIVNAENHHGQLLDWTASCQLGTTQQAPYLDERYLAYFPEELINKGRLSPATDLYMAAWCMIFILGGNPSTLTIPDSVPRPLRSMLNKCLQPRSIRRFQSAEELYAECGRINGILFGPPQFVQFVMP